MKYLSDSLRGKREDDKTYIRKNGRKAQTQKGSLKMEKRRMAWEKVGLIKERRSDRLKKNVKGKTCCFMGERERTTKHETKLYYGKDLKKICGSLHRTVSICPRNSYHFGSFRSAQLLGE